MFPGDWRIEPYLTTEGYRLRLDAYVEHRPGIVDPLGPGIEFTLCPLSPNCTEVTIVWHSSAFDGYVRALLADIVSRWPESGLVRPEPREQEQQTKPGPTGDAKAERRRLGAHGNTQERVKEACLLVQGGMPVTRACKKVGTDIRTYQRYVLDHSLPEGDDA